MSKLSALLARAKVLATSLATWLTIGVAVLTEAENEIGKVWAIPQPVVQWTARIVTIVTAAVLFIRTHMPVAKNQQGILPPAQQLPSPRGDTGSAELVLVLRIVALVAFVIVCLAGFGVITVVHVFGWLGLGLAAWLLSTFA